MTLRTSIPPFLLLPLFGCVTVPKPKAQLPVAAVVEPEIASPAVADVELSPRSVQQPQQVAEATDSSAVTQTQTTSTRIQTDTLVSVLLAVGVILALLLSMSGASYQIGRRRRLRLAERVGRELAEFAVPKPEPGTATRRAGRRSVGIDRRR